MEDSLISVLENQSSHKFQGRHMMASLIGCSSAALLNVDGLLENLSAAATAAGATVLDTRHHLFPNGGITAVLLLSESHASIHTYPENSACFVDLFTCGTSVDQSKFNQVLSSYLKPTQINQNTFNRGLTAELVEFAASISE
ncbi:adenosylmethionine decarboxylase [soil metagenome]